MQLIYYRGRTLNFGDDLNAAVWPALAPRLFDDDVTDGFVGIGTIIGLPIQGVRTLHVFGSGIGNNRLDNWAGQHVRYWCVRGPISARLLGLPESRALTDGAILVPLVHGYPATAAGGGGVAVMPHWETLDHPGWDAVAAQTGFDVIDPRDDPLAVVQRLGRARLVLTESLHGAIIADTYGIPWTAFATSKNFGGTKWVDWAMSLGMEFSLTMVPPPGAGPVLQFGRGQAEYGKRVTLTVESALRDFAERIRPAALRPPTLKERAKQAVKQAAWLHPLLGFNPSRTAAALTALAATEPCLSRDSIRSGLRGRMLECLASVESEQPAAALVA